MHPGPSSIIPVQNTECEADVPSSFVLRTEPVEYFYFLFDLDLLDFIPQETTLNGNKKKMRNMPSTKRAIFA